MFQLFVTRDERGSNIAEDGEERHNSGLTLNYWCFSAKIAMASLLGMRVRSVIFTSGTLSPIARFAADICLFGAVLD